MDLALAIAGEDRERLTSSWSSSREAVRLPPAAAASMAALREAGCSTVKDYLSRAAGPVREGFRIIILASSRWLVDLHDDTDYDIPSALGWDSQSVEHLRQKRGSAPNLVHMLEDSTLRWGVDAFFFFLSDAQFQQIEHIPPVTALCLCDHFLDATPPERDLRKVFRLASSCSPNLIHLFCIFDVREYRWVRLQAAFQTNTSLQSIFFGTMQSYIDFPPKLSWEAPATALASHPSLAFFSLHGPFAPNSGYVEVIRELFGSAFEHNPRLITLSFDSGCPWQQPLYDVVDVKELDNCRKVVLDGLRRHGTVHQVSFGACPVDNNVIAAQLKKNKENAERMELLRAKLKNIEQVRPSTVRLYLCGLPFAGKTSVAKALAKWIKMCSLIRYPWSSRRLKPIKFCERTRGIAVTVIESQLVKGQRMSVWDMAGQLEYHSFHDSMLPDLGDRTIPSLFLFVWNPYRTNIVNGQLVQDTRVPGGRSLVLNRLRPAEFSDDLRYWLKFLVSKMPKSNILKPKVVVVITRADLGLPDMKIELGSAFESVRVEFEEYVHLNMSEGLFEVDATDPKTMYKLASYLFECTKSILEMTPKELNICITARELFAKRTQEGTLSPLITKEKFFGLCWRHLGIADRATCEAVALSLNCSGDVIFFPNLELVVMDTQWFCLKIMGDILHFNMTPSSATNKYQPIDGFYKRDFLQKLLEEELSSRRGWRFSWTRDESLDSMKVAGSHLVKLLIGLQLACPKDYTQEYSDIFVPTSLCGNTRRQRLNLPRKYLNESECHRSIYVGRRLSVRDSNRTLLTPGIFPRLQVIFHDTLSALRINVDLEQDVMAFADRVGSRVVMEFCALAGRDHFIDILVCSGHTPDKALEWMHENVIAKMMKVFADPRGIPGVDITHSVIQPSCIRGLLEASQRQAVPIQDLRDTLREHIERYGTQLLVGDGNNMSVIHTWHSEPLEDDDVMSLLGEAEVVKVIEAYMSSLSEVARDVLDLTAASTVEEESRSKHKRPEFGTLASQKQMEGFYDLMQDAHEMLQEMRKDVKEIKAGMKRLSQQVDDLRGTVLSRLGELFTFEKETEAGKLPRMFVVTEDDGRVRRVVCKMVPGLHKLRLELLCECHSSSERPHMVDGQHGLGITTLDDGLLKRGLPYIHGILKLAYVATKIGAHVAAGYSEMIPDFSGILASKNMVADAPESSLSQWNNSSSRVDFRSGQQWLLDVLASNDCTSGGKIYEQFGLRRMRYASSKTVAWVCKAHYSEHEAWPA